MRQLPLNGRSWTDLVTLEPGVSSITTQQALATGGQTRANRGFGQEFIQGIWGNLWGDQCFKDLMRVTDVLPLVPAT